MEHFTNDGLTFPVTDTGPPGAAGPVVVALHGFPEDRSSWDGVAPPLAAAGCRVLAPDLRGYPPSARPPRRRDYVLSRTARDVLALADAAGAERIHVVGHDWGAALGWYLAARHPDRVASLVALSVPHPRALLAALVRSDQALRSWYMAAFQLPVLPERLLAAGRGERLRRSLVASGLDDAHARRYAARAARPERMTGPVNWYRALPLNGRGLPPVTVPTRYVWSDGDRFVARRGAELCGRWVAGPYRFEVLPGVSHWIPEQRPERTAELVLDHLAGV